MTEIHPKYIEIDGGTVTASRIIGAEGVRFLDHEIGTFQFFIDLVEVDGGRIGLWSGLDYEQAIREAEQARREWEIDEPVHDLVAGGAA